MSNFNASASKTEPLNLTRRVNPLEALREVFAPCVDLNYARFARSGLPKEVLSPVLGLRVPLLRSIAYRIEKSEIEGTIATLLRAGPEALEERLFVAILIGRLRVPIEAKFPLLRAFLPFVDSWMVCDELAAFVKPLPKEKELFWSFLGNLCDEGSPYVTRYGLVSVLKYYMDASWIEEVLSRAETVARRKIDARCVETALAWLVAEVAARFPDRAVAFLREEILSPRSKRMAIQKGLESLRVADDVKAELKRMRKSD